MTNIPPDSLPCRYSIDDGFVQIENKEIQFYRISFGEYILQNTWLLPEVASLITNESFMGNEIQILFQNHTRINLHSNQNIEEIQNWIQKHFVPAHQTSHNKQDSKTFPSTTSNSISSKQQKSSALTSTEVFQKNDINSSTGTTEDPNDTPKQDQSFNKKDVNTKNIFSVVEAKKTDVNDERNEELDFLNKEKQLQSEFDADLEKLERMEKEEQRVHDFMSSATSTNSNYLTPFFPSPKYFILFLACVSICFPFGLFIYLGLVYKHNKDADISANTQ